MHDGCTNNGSHYLAKFAVMMRQVLKFVNAKDVVVEELSMSLVSMSPAAMRGYEGDVIDAYAISFDT